MEWIKELKYAIFIIIFGCYLLFEGNLATEQILCISIIATIIMFISTYIIHNMTKKPAVKKQDEQEQIENKISKIIDKQTKKKVTFK